MAALLVALGGVQDEMHLLSGVLAFARADLAMLAEGLGDTVLFLRHGADGRNLVFASGWIAAIAAERGDGERLQARISDFRYLPMALVHEAPATSISIISPEERDLLLEVSARQAPGLEEAAAAFIEDWSPEGGMAALQRIVLAGYDHHCAFTGAAHPPVAGLYSGLDLVAIKPLTDGGRLHPSNFLPAVPEAARAFERGHLAVGPGLGLLVALDGIDPELLERLEPIGRLRAPVNPAMGPDPVALAHHRATRFDRPAAA